MGLEKNGMPQSRPWMIYLFQVEKVVGKKKGRGERTRKNVLDQRSPKIETGPCNQLLWQSTTLRIINPCRALHFVNRQIDTK